MNERIIYSLLNLALLAVMPFLMAGLITRTKSRWAGRQGPPVLQPFYDFARLLRKGRVFSQSTSFIFHLAPPAALAAVLCAALLTPLAGATQFEHFPGDFVLFAYMLGLARFLMALSALDTASSFEGMGASREASFAIFVEPAFFLFAGSFALVSGHTSLGDMMVFLQRGTGWGEILSLMAAVLLFLMMLAETCRVPVDDPTTHLELTMIHEVMVLDNSGPDLAHISFQNALKMFLYTALMCAILIPSTGSPWLDALGLAAFAAAIAIVIGFVESLMARLRMNLVPQFLFTLTTLGFVILSISVLFLSGGYL
jgi:formate hydrogenlyase subunit 4